MDYAKHIARADLLNATIVIVVNEAVPISVMQAVSICVIDDRDAAHRHQQSGWRGGNLPSPYSIKLLIVKGMVEAVGVEPAQGTDDKQVVDFRNA
jgi:hypothetical protein